MTAPMYNDRLDGLYDCTVCGAVVADICLHDDWHALLVLVDNPAAAS